MYSATWRKQSARSDHNSMGILQNQDNAMTFGVLSYFVLLTGINNCSPTIKLLVISTNFHSHFAYVHHTLADH